MRAIRGCEIGMIFQEPMTSLNPVYSVGDQIVEAIRLHQDLSRSATRERAVAMLGEVGIASPERRFHEYPHQMSGGMRQRVMIAMALSCNPSLLIADEPTTALDVTIQAQILELMSELKRKFGTAIMFITHDLGVIAEIARRVIVMYAGRIVEQAPVADIFETPCHPYTAGAPGEHPVGPGHPREIEVDRDQGDGARTDGHAVGLPLSSALPEEDGYLRGKDPGPVYARFRPPGCLLAVWSLK